MTLCLYVFRSKAVRELPLWMPAAPKTLLQKAAPGTQTGPPSPYTQAKSPRQELVKVLGRIASFPAVLHPCLYGSHPEVLDCPVFLGSPDLRFLCPYLKPELSR